MFLSINLATMCYCKLYFSHHILWSCILVLIPVPRYNSFHHLRVLGCYILLVFLGILCHMLQNMCSTLSIHWNHRWSCCCRYEVKLYCIVKGKLWLKIWQHLADVNSSKYPKTRTSQLSNFTRSFQKLTI